MTKMTLVFSACVLLGAASVARAQIPANIQFDGYCDGMTGLTATEPSSAAGVWTNLDCIGTSARVGGLQGKGKGETAKGYIVASFGVGPVYGLEVVWVINKDRTWSAYRANDGVYLNRGTWTAVAEGTTPARGARPSVAR